jgi:hypothetical protein
LALGGALATVALVAVALVAACGGSGGSDSPPTVPAPSGEPGMGQAEALTNCTTEVADSGALQRALGAANPGDRICLSGDMGSERLELERSGTPDQPIVILGGGEATTKGVSVEADNVIIDGVIARQPSAPGFELNGTNITMRNSASLSPRGGDGDGIRFFGQNIKILHNTISDTRGTDERHADCMQTFATDDQYTASRNVLIDSNRCENIDNICLIAEGPHSEADDGSGEGRSADFVFSNNYCDNGAGQALFVDDISNVTVVGNQIVGDVDKAFSFQNESTGAKVSDNQVASGIGYEVGIDDTSEQDYRGPEPGGGP